MVAALVPVAVVKVDLASPRRTEGLVKRGGDPPEEFSLSQSPSLRRPPRPLTGSSWRWRWGRKWLALLTMRLDRTGLHSFRVLLEGQPKVGKTTVIERLAKLLVGAGVPVGGFVTREVLGDDGRRVGFKVRDLAGPEAWLAHQDFDTGIRVGRFGVDKVAFEQVGLTALEGAVRLARDQDGVAIIDEIARMELVSAGFVESIKEIFAHPTTVVATVHASEHPVTDALKRRKDIELINVAEVNRDDLPVQLFHQLTSPTAHSDPA